MEPLNRRGFLRLGGLAGAAWLTPIGHMLARAAETTGRQREPAQSIIVIWLAGGPSQLETFDPHPSSKIAGGTGAINTAVKGIQLAPGLERTAEEMQSISLIRSLVSKEGDHERGTYTLKTGFRPDPTVIHPSIGAICCHELPVGTTDIPRHVSILPGQWPARGGYLGDQYNAFRIGDPSGPGPDTKSFLPADSDDQRLKNLDVVESAFAKGREKRVAATLHRETVTGARKMMTSDQLKAFDVSKEVASLRKAYGETPF